MFDNAITLLQLFNRCGTRAMKKTAAYVAFRRD